jgi:sigma-54 specific flagellar transcriptional regulator A
VTSVADNRDFFAALADVVFGNPFTPKRDALIVRLAPDAPQGDLVSDREALTRVVAPKLEALLRDSCAELRRLSAVERKVVEPALLYVGYHRAVPHLDALIDKQKDTNTPLPVPFGDDIIGWLVNVAGFPQERSTRYFALYYQLRRGFYFIHRSLAGRSESMRRFRQALWNNIFTHDMRTFEAALWDKMEDFSTLLLGETGTGKGNAARAIGRSAFIPYLTKERRFAASFRDTFLAINLSQFPESLIESELFGHRKGAFSGAIEHHQGVFERCSPHGALFLDEIGEVHTPVQIKLLQVLQEREFTPVGERETRRFSGRVIAATNRRLAALRGDGRFRDDFFYRLCSDVIEVPPLRQRLAESPGELEELVRPLVEEITKTQDAEMVAGVLQGLREGVPRGYSWPGNVRELEQAIRRVLLTGRYAPDAAAAADPDEALVEKLRAGALTSTELLAHYSAMLHRRLGSYAAVARRTGLDPRTSRKYIDGARSG